MSISYRDIVQLITQCRDASSHTNAAFENNCHIHDPEVGKAMWAASVRTFSAQSDQHENWIERWMFNALTYGQESTHDDTRLVRCLTKVDLIALFIEFSWYLLLSNDELNAIKTLNDCRSNLHLATLPNGFKAADVVVEFNRTPTADNPTLVGKNIRLVVDDHGMANTSVGKRPLNHLSTPPNTPPFQQTPVIRQEIGENRPLSPLTPLTSSHGPKKKRKSTKSLLSPTRKKRSTSTSQPVGRPMVDDCESDVAEDLPSITVVREPFRRDLAKGPVEPSSNWQPVISQTSFDLAEDLTAAAQPQYILEASHPPTTDAQVDLALIDDTPIPHNSFNLTKPLSRSLQSSSTNDASELSGLPTEDKEPSLSKRKTASDGFTTDPEDEPSRKKRRSFTPDVNLTVLEDNGLGTTSACNTESSAAILSAHQKAIASQTGDAVPGNEFARTTTSCAEISSSTTTIVGGHEMPPETQAPYLPQPAVINEQELKELKELEELKKLQDLYTPMVMRRQSRQAAKTAHGRIHLQYTVNPLENLDDSASPSQKAKRTKTKKEVHEPVPEQTAVDTIPFEDTTLSPDGKQEPDSANVNVGMRKRGCPPGKSKGKGKGKGKRKDKKIADPTNAGSPRRGSLSKYKDSSCDKSGEEVQVHLSESKGDAPSPFCSSSNGALPQEALNQLDLSPGKKRRGRPPKNKDDKQGKVSVDISSSNQIIPEPQSGEEVQLHLSESKDDAPSSFCPSSNSVLTQETLNQRDKKQRGRSSKNKGDKQGRVSVDISPPDQIIPEPQSGEEVQMPLSESKDDAPSSFYPSSNSVLPQETLNQRDKEQPGRSSKNKGDKQGKVSTDISPSNQIIPQTQSSDDSLLEYNCEEVAPHESYTYTQLPQASSAPWTLPPDETNYSNNSRPPGINDTHSWSTIPQVQSPSPKVNFPPLQGDSLCSDVRLYKPELPNRPPVWAHSRQELCESLSYFRAYQGGVYTHKQRAEGYLLDGYPARYDIWHSDGRYIISHGGGHSAVDRMTGRVSLVEDQVADRSCAALISTWKSSHAIVLIAGSGYKLFPYSLGSMNYVVLGYYHIVHAWEEPEPSSSNPRGYCVRWKFLFRWIEAQGSPWWLSEKQTSNSMDIPLLPAEICPSCGESSCHIFGYGWVCTQSSCQAFFQLSDKTNVMNEGYNPAFLAPREDPQVLRALKFNVRPKPPVQPVIRHDTEQPQLATSRHFWKGFWCEKCGKLSCREFWTYWKCSNCDHTFAIKAIIQAPPKVNNVKLDRFFARGAGIIETTSRLGNESDPYECFTFTLPFNRGRIHLIKASGRSLQTADRIFRQYQLDASNDESFFRRYSMKTHKLKGRMLSHYFSQNSGEPYQYVGGTNNTVELDKYKSVTEALEYIRSRATLALKYNPEFNEVLSAGYMEEQKMEFHSDGEKDLGPIVASLSLGSPAIMKFRPVPSKWLSDDGQLKEGRKTPPVVIELTLRHGDALVMEGAEIQEYYQHAVHPCGFRIAATARRVDIT